MQPPRRDAEQQGRPPPGSPPHDPLDTRHVQRRTSPEGWAPASRPRQASEPRPSAALPVQLLDRASAEPARKVPHRHVAPFVAHPDRARPHMVARPRRGRNGGAGSPPRLRGWRSGVDTRGEAWMKSRSGGHANDAGTFGGPGAESARDGSTRSGGGGGGGGGTRSWVGCPRFSSIAALGVAVICLLLVALSTQHLLLFQLAWPQVVPTGVWHDGGGAPQWLPPYAATGTARPMTQLTVCPCGACSVDTGERWFDFSAVAQGHDVTLQWLAEDTGEEVLVATNPCGRLDSSFLGELAGTPSLVRVCVCVCVCGGGACARFVCRWLCLSPTSFIPTEWLTRACACACVLLCCALVLGALLPGAARYRRQPLATNLRLCACVAQLEAPVSVIPRRRSPQPQPVL